jgi:hypothetical protein
VVLNNRRHRYEALATAGFPVIDSRHHDGDLIHHLQERIGGHYVDTGNAVKLIERGKVRIKSLVEPVAYLEKGLRFSDESTLDADAIVWCTGFGDRDIRSSIKDILGDDLNPGSGNFLGPTDVATRLDTTLALDEEGEVRGMFRRHLRMDHFWVMGGDLLRYRWYSRVLAQQLKMAVEGILPQPFLESP